jgi:hypothetical protein
MSSGTLFGLVALVVDLEGSMEMAKPSVVNQVAWSLISTSAETPGSMRRWNGMIMPSPYEPLQRL